MEGKCSNFWLGMGIGSVIGMFAYRFCCAAARARRLKYCMCHGSHEMNAEGHEMMETAKEKVMQTGATVADKAADKVENGALNVAEKADEFKNKVHNYTSDNKK